MKFRKEPEARREEVETRNTQRRELTDEGLEWGKGGSRNNEGNANPAIQKLYEKSSPPRAEKGT